MTSSKQKWEKRILFLGAMLLSAYLIPDHARKPVSRSYSTESPANAAPGKKSQITQLPAMLRKGAELEYSLQRSIWLDSSLLPGDAPVGYRAKFIIRVVENLPNERGWLCEAELKEDETRTLINAQFEISPTFQIAALRGIPDNEAGWALRDALSAWAFFSCEDTSGEYLATFGREKGTWVKSKVRYLADHMGSNPPKVLYSRHKMTWDDKASAPRKLEGSETWLVERDGGKIKLTYRLQLLSNRTLTKSETSDSPVVVQSIVRNFKRKIRTNQKSRSWNEIFAGLEKSEEMSGRDRMALFSEVLLALGERPDLATELAALARHHGASASRVFSMAIGALASDGGPQAQAALRSLYQDARLPENSKGQILAAWTTTDQALDPPTRELLRRESEGDNSSLSAGASFALGSSMKKSPDPESIEALRRIHASANTSEDREKAIDAMGNSGQTVFLSSLRQDLASLDERMRASAAFSLRFIPGDEARNTLLSALNDPNDKVRTSAVEAVRFRPGNENWTATLQRCSTNDPIPGVRETCRRVNQEVQTKEGGNS